MIEFETFVNIVDFTVQIFDEKDKVSPAYVISNDTSGVSNHDLVRMRECQRVVEWQWLQDNLILAFISSEADVSNYKKDLIHLYENVYLVQEEDWDVLNKIDRVLMNDSMYGLCKYKERPGLNIDTAAEIRQLFEERDVFCVTWIE